MLSKAAVKSRDITHTGALVNSACATVSRIAATAPNMLLHGFHSVGWNGEDHSATDAGDSLRYVTAVSGPCSSASGVSSHQGV
jgi:hypothetical protein